MIISPKSRKTRFGVATLIYSLPFRTFATFRNFLEEFPPSAEPKRRKISLFAKKCDLGAFGPKIPSKYRYVLHYFLAGGHLGAIIHPKCTLASEGARRPFPTSCSAPAGPGRSPFPTFCSLPRAARGIPYMYILLIGGPAPAPSDSQETGHTLGCA